VPLGQFQKDLYLRKGLSVGREPAMTGAKGFQKIETIFSRLYKNEERTSSWSSGLRATVIAYPEIGDVDAEFDPRVLIWRGPLKTAGIILGLGNFVIHSMPLAVISRRTPVTAVRQSMLSTSSILSKIFGSKMRRGQ